MEDKKKCFLLYAVSVGEMKVASLLYKEIRRDYPDSCVMVAARTRTGYEEARRVIPGADEHFLLPFDFSWLMRRLHKNLKPDEIIVMESDLWYNFLRQGKKQGAFLFLVSGRISQVSYERFRSMPFLSRKLFSLFDGICVQNALFLERFLSLGVSSNRVFVGGNLKINGRVSLLSSEQRKEWKELLGIGADDLVLVIGSTHDPEERALLDGLMPLWEEFTHLKVILVPRHPNRFVIVEKMLEEKRISYCLFSKITEKTGKEKVILLDQMGLLESMYQLGTLAITCGSFFSPLRGHNILEPILCQVPVLFGPYMEGQTDLVEMCLSYQAGLQVSLQELPSMVTQLLLDRQRVQELRENGQKLIEQTEGVVTSTWNYIQLEVRKTSP